MNNTLSNICPLCQKIQSSLYHQDKNRSYLQCQACYLVYVPDEFHLCSEDEKKQYDFHTNNPQDPGYRKFLSRLFAPLCQKLSIGDKGLDFGSGPGPTLSVMLAEKGFKMSVYDKFYAKDECVFNFEYDFITATEVFEHLHHPAQEIKCLLSLLKPYGYLGIMTKLATTKDKFTHWHYKNDLTHICFFSQASFNWIARKYQLKLEFIGSDVIILQKLSFE